MSNFDPQQVIDTVRIGSIPKAWRVFRAQPSTFGITGFFFAGLALIFVGIALGALTPYDVLGWIVLPDKSGDMSGVWLFSGIFGLLGIGCAIPAIWFFAKMPALKDQLIAITPNGIVEYRGARMGIVVAAAYANLARVSLPENTRGGVLVLVFKRLPGASAPFRWIIGERYMYPAKIAQAVIESFTRYTANNTPNQTEEA